jgi:hypothetical protein
MEEKSAVSGVSTLNGNFYRTKVVDNGDGTLSSTLFRTDAQGNNEVPIAGYAADEDGVVTVVNTTNATPEEQQLLADPNSPLNEVRKSQTREVQSELTGGEGAQTPNPDQQGGSTPASPTPNNTSPPPIMLKYPLTIDDGQDKIKFVPLELVKTTLGGGEVSIVSPQYKKPMDEDTTVFIGIQGSITDQNAVTWGSGELNPLQKAAVNKSMQFMKNPQKAVDDTVSQAQDALTDEETRGILGDFGRLYLAEQGVGVGGLLSRATGSVVNPNLELLFQAPTLRTFQFQFKMSPRNKNEADEVKKIIRLFKRRMAAKKGKDGLFLKAPNVFKIQYLKGSKIHPSINLIKVCALLNFAVDYTPNGSYMTFGGGDKGDPEASMVTYNLSMSFQEIEPIYETDYTQDFEYGDGEKIKVTDNKIGA